MDSTEKENKELATSILAGEMKNAWEAEDRPNQPDTRPPSMRPQHRFVHTRAYRDNYDAIFRRVENGDKNEKA